MIAPDFWLRTPGTSPAPDPGPCPPDCSTDTDQGAAGLTYFDDNLPCLFVRLHVAVGIKHLVESKDPVDSGPQGPGANPLEDEVDTSSPFIGPSDVVEH